MGDVAAPALPVNRPAAALNAQVVRRHADHGEALEVFCERQNVFSVFEHHQRFAHALARDGAVFRRADGGGQLWIGRSAVKNSELEFDPQDA